MGNLGAGLGEEPEPAQRSQDLRAGAEPRREGDGEFKVPRSLADVIVEIVKAGFKLARNPDVRGLLKNPWTYTVVSILLSLSIAGAAFWKLGGVTWPEFISAKKNVDTKSVVAEDVVTIDGIPFRKEYAESVKAALADDKSYFIDAVTMLYDIEDTVDQHRKPIRKISWRNTYTITALKDIHPKDPAFIEVFKTSAAQEYPWAGTEQEERIPPDPIGKKFYVSLDLKKGERRTFTTGIDLDMSLPRPKDRQDYLGHDLVQNEDYAAYPNSDDYIGNLLLTVRSRGTAVKPNSDLAAYTSFNLSRDADERKRKPEQAEVRYNPQSQLNGWHTISKEWTDVPPGEELAIYFKW